MTITREGEPIIQNGQIVGAVTHMLVNDPTQGYEVDREYARYSRIKLRLGKCPCHFLLFAVVCFSQQPYQS